MQRLLVLLTALLATAAGVPPAAAVDDPLITSPPTGAVVGETVTVAATTQTAGTVHFRLDGTTVASDDQQPYSAVIAMTGRDAGPHVLDVLVCPDPSSDPVTCGGPVSDPVTITYLRLSPAITSVLPSPFSPNGDGRRDTTTVAYTLDYASVVTLEAWRGGTKVDTDVVSATPLASGAHRYVWNGRASGVLPSGTYQLRLVASKASPYGAPATGTGTGTVRIDLVRPTIGTPSRSLATVYPVRDGFKDTVRFRSLVDEPVTGGVLTIKSSSGRTVRTIAVGSSTSTLTGTWNGRTASGSIAAPGSYRASFSARDVAGNLRRSASTAVVVSDAYLVGKTYSRTVTAYGSAIGDASGSCSSVGRIDRWRGALGYYSMYRWVAGLPCDPYAPYTDIALAKHSVGVPGAAKYGTLRIDVRGGSAPTYRDVGVLMYQRRDGEVTSAKVMGSAVGWHAGRSVGGAAYVVNGRVRWWLGTSDVNWYDVEKYRVTLRYFVLTDPTRSSSFAVSGGRAQQQALVENPAHVVARVTPVAGAVKESVPRSPGGLTSLD